MGAKVFEMLDRAEPIEGEVGIEVEMEGGDLPMEVPKYWRVEGDGSLRNGLEYVLHAPCDRHDVNDVVSHLFKHFQKTKAVLNPTNRTSIHVHINVQELDMVQVFNFICLYLIFEDALVRWCGNLRQGNLFCLRAKDAEYLVDLLEEVAQSQVYYKLDTDKIRYAAINCKALWKYGSLEFRSMRGTDDPQVILDWVSILLKIKDAAVNYQSPVHIVDGFSEGGEEWFCRNILGDEHFERLFNYKGWDTEVYGGVRRCQCIAYGGYWGNEGGNKMPRPEKKEVKEKQLFGGLQAGALVRAEPPGFQAAGPGDVWAIDEAEWEAPDPVPQVQAQAAPEPRVGRPIALIPANKPHRLERVRLYNEHIDLTSRFKREQLRGLGYKVKRGPVREGGKWKVIS